MTLAYCFTPPPLSRLGQQQSGVIMYILLEEPFWTDVWNAKRYDPASVGCGVVREERFLSSEIAGVRTSRNSTGGFSLWAGKCPRRKIRAAEQRFFRVVLTEVKAGGQDWAGLQLTSHIWKVGLSLNPEQ